MSLNAKPASDVASARLRALCPPPWAGRPCPAARVPHHDEAARGFHPDEALRGAGGSRVTPVQGGTGSTARRSSDEWWEPGRPSNCQ